jgi:hypothetical protein
MRASEQGYENNICMPKRESPVTPASARRAVNSPQAGSPRRPHPPGSARPVETERGRRLRAASLRRTERPGPNIVRSKDLERYIRNS